MLSLNFDKNVFIIGQVNNIITRIRPLKILKSESYEYSASQVDY